MMDNDRIKQLKLFFSTVFPPFKKEMYGNFYYTYHPSGENFATNPKVLFLDNAIANLEDAIEEGQKFGLIDKVGFIDVDSFTSYPVMLASPVLPQTISWIEGMLLYSVIEEIVDEFRHYQGEYSIDPTGKGKFMDEDLKKLYRLLFNFMGKLETAGIPVREFVDLTPIDLEESETLSEKKNRLSEEYSRWWNKEGKFLKEEELTNRPMTLRRYLDEKYGEIVEKNYRGIKNKKEKKNKFLEIFQTLNEDLVKVGFIDIDSHMVKGGLTTNPVVRTWTREIMEQIDSGDISTENIPEGINPPVNIGDFIQLLHMEDPWNPVPIATTGVVLGFEDLPGNEKKILVRWIMGIDEDGNETEFRNMPLLPEVDVYRLAQRREPVTEIKKSLIEGLLKEETTTQEIEYKKVGQPQRYGNKEYVYFTGTNVEKDPTVEFIILTGPNGDITIDSLEVKDAKYGGVQVNYNNKTRNILDPILDFVDPNKECNFSSQVLNDGKWKRGGLWRNKTFSAIQKSLQNVYADKIAGTGEPTERHIPNGFINIPGTEAAGTKHGWSIINFFNTNPVIRRMLVQEYETHIKENDLPCRFDIGEFTNWITQNRYEIFGYNTELFKRLVDANQKTWQNGQNNEVAVIPFLDKFYDDSWDVVYDGEPGIFKDALNGVDIVVVNNESGEEHTYQAKPLSYVEKMGDNWLVNSGWLHRYDPTKVSHYIFGPGKNGESIIFKNEGQSPTQGGRVMVFNYPPLA
tara:strand:- start:4589 stop:6811 length:2223 start_codon:yes stop_codon:yes gene_type:complete